MDKLRLNDYTSFPFVILIMFIFSVTPESVICIKSVTLDRGNTSLRLGNL